MTARRTMMACRGVSPTTGKSVGSRHRWNSGGTCRFCWRTRESALESQAMADAREARHAATMARVAAAAAEPAAATERPCHGDWPFPTRG